MNYTTNYQLPQWVKEDRIMMEDFNDMTAKVDEALGEQGENIESLQASVEKCGTCGFYYASYVGNSSTSPISYTFPAKPMIFMVANGRNGFSFIACRGMSQVYPHHSTGTIQLQLTWADRSVSWNYSNGASNNMNAAGDTYYIVALLDMSA